MEYKLILVESDARLWVPKKALIFNQIDWPVTPNRWVTGKQLVREYEGCFHVVRLNRKL